MPVFHYQPIFELAEDHTVYRKLSGDGVSVGELDGQEILMIEGSVLGDLAAAAVRDVSHLFRSSHLQQLAKILEDNAEACASPGEERRLSRVDLANVSGDLAPIETGSAKTIRSASHSILFSMPGGGTSSPSTDMGFRPILWSVVEAEGGKVTPLGTRCTTPPGPSSTTVGWPK